LLAALVEDELHRLAARLQLHAALRERLEVLPTAGVRDLDGAGLVHAVELEAELPAPLVARDHHLDRVGARLLDVDGVDEPLAGPGPAEVEFLAGVFAPLEIDARLAVRRLLRLLVGRLQIVVGDALAALVEVLGLDRAGNRVDLVLVGAAGTGPFRAGRAADGKDEQQRKDRSHGVLHFTFRRGRIPAPYSPSGGRRPGNSTGDGPRRGFRTACT